ncbi:uncharacterized protein V6R79_008520 [Siganus canaliculatus]
MDSVHWARSSGQPWSTAGSLWGWVVSRLHLDWTARFFQEDEEMLILTHSDELNRAYGEENRLPHDNNTNKTNTSWDDTRRNTPTLNEQDNPCMTERPAPSLVGSTSTSAFKDTRAKAISSGFSAISEASAVSTSTGSHWFRNSKCSGGGRTRRTETHREKPGSISEEIWGFNQNQGDEGRLYQAAQLLHGSIRTPLEDANKKKENEEKKEGTSQICERATVTGSDLVQNPKTGGSGPLPAATITAWEAGWNVTNAIQGIFVLGLPFALARSGYAGLFLLVLSAWVCNYTGRILVACLYEEEPSGSSGSVAKVRVRHSYQDIVEACCTGLWPSWPRLAGCMVNVGQVTELLMTCTLYLVVSTSLLTDSLSSMAVPRSVCSVVSLTFLLPCLLLTDLRPVSTLSLLCSLAHILISLLVMLYCLSRSSSWNWSCLSLSVDPEDFLVSVGVIIFSYTSQIFLPPLECSMEDRGQFNTMLGWTHGAACIMKTLFSLLRPVRSSQTSCPLTCDLSSTCAFWLKPCCPTLCLSTLLLKSCRSAC